MQSTPHGLPMKRISLIIFKTVTAFILFIYFAVWLLSPSISDHFIKKAIVPYNLSLNDSSSLRYNPFISQVHVQDFSLEKDEETVFSIDSLTIEISLVRLLFKELYISEFFADAIQGSVKISDHNIVIAGVELPQSKQTEPTKKSAKSNEYQLVMPALVINNSKVDLTLNSTHLPIQLHSIKLSDVKATETAQSAALNTTISLDGAQVKLSAQADLIDHQGEILSEIALNDFNLSQLSPWLPENIKKLAGEVTVNGKQKINLNGTSTTAELAQTALTLKNISLEQENILLTIKENNVSFPNIDITLDDNAPLLITGNGQTDITSLQAVNAQSPELLIAEVKNIRLNDIALTSPESVPTVTFAQVNIDEVVLSKNITTEEPAFTQFSSLVFNNVNVSQLATDIDTISLSDLVVNTHINAEKEVTSLSAISSITQVEVSDEVETVAVQDTTTQHTEKKATPYHVSLNQFKLLNEAKIALLDASVEPSFQQAFTIEEFSVANVNSRAKDQESTVTLKGKNDEYTQLNLNGLLKPFKEKPLYKVKGDITEINLHVISAYIKNTLNYEIKSGQLDFKIDTTLTGDIISGDANILLRGLDFTAADDHEVDSIKDQTAIPFSAALGMLKDSQGNVDLSLPLSGNINAPSFGVTGFMTLLVKRATMMAAKDYLMTTFVPYANVVSVAMSAGEFLLKVRFNDLTFEPTSAELSENHQSFLKQFATLMKDKPDTQITLCAIATPQDVGLTPGTKITDKKTIAELHALSLKRTSNFKQTMVSTFKLASSRLLLCTPQIDSAKDAQPRLSFSS